ncbi:MAG: DivIVA domain-containing protein [Chitinispirillaceae bacterium]|jgi:cell division initiation protein
MHVSPLDIKNQQFSRSFRGFNPDAVNSFLNLLANELEELIRQNSDNATRIKGLEEQLENYAKIERSINEALLLAQQTASEVSQNARKKADVIVKEATLRAEQEAAEVRERIGKLKAEYVSLQSQRDAFFARFKGLLTSQLSLLPALSDDVEEKTDANNIAPAARLSDEPEEASPVVEEIFDSEK